LSTPEPLAAIVQTCFNVLLCPISGHGIQRIEKREDLCDDTMPGAFICVF
jgi:hypothetical protein